MRTFLGWGEASHGTREFFQFKHRLFRYLVEEHDIRMLGLETNFAALLDVNGYVMRGEGTAETTLR
jgi:erythromycin esterase